VPAVTRYIIIGAGAVGVTLAAELRRAGRDVLLVARGGQLAALRSGTLRYARPDATRTLGLPVAAGPDEVALAEGDVLILTTKTQDADAVLADWAWRPARSGDGSERAAAAVIPVITVQNGLDAERAALRRFATVLGGVLWVAAGYVADGEVAATGWPAATRKAVVNPRLKAAGDARWRFARWLAVCCCLSLNHVASPCRCFRFRSGPTRGRPETGRRRTGQFPVRPESVRTRNIWQEAPCETPLT
jgi:ketopantoate reductase